MGKKKIIVAAVILVVIAGGVSGYFLVKNQKSQVQLVNQITVSPEEVDIRTLVSDFAERMKLVSLTAPKTELVAAMENAYSPYVSSDLLTQWEQNPQNAPGRQTSSPWPDHIEITSVTKNGDGNAYSYIVQGDIVELTSKELVSGGVAAKYLAIIQVDKINGQWKISAFDRGPELPGGQ